MFSFYEKFNNTDKITDYKFRSPTSGWKKEEDDTLAFSL